MSSAAQRLPMSCLCSRASCRAMRTKRLPKCGWATSCTTCAVCSRTSSQLQVIAAAVPSCVSAGAYRTTPGALPCLPAGAALSLRHGTQLPRGTYMHMYAFPH